MKRTMTTAALLCVLAAVGCRPAIDMPDGFVTVEDSDRDPYDLRAVSADGVALGVRRHDNPENGTLDFWAEAVRNELTSGRHYKLAKTEPIESKAGLSGRLLTFTVEKSGTPFTYVVAVYVSSRQVTLAEAGGKTEAVKPRLAAIKEAMATVR